jgi:hypothetical protein
VTQPQRTPEEWIALANQLEESMEGYLAGHPEGELSDKMRPLLLLLQHAMDPEKDPPS